MTRYFEYCPNLGRRLVSEDFSKMLTTRSQCMPPGSRPRYRGISEIASETHHWSEKSRTGHMWNCKKLDFSRFHGTCPELFGATGAILLHPGGYPGSSVGGSYLLTQQKLWVVARFLKIHPSQLSVGAREKSGGLVRERTPVKKKNPPTGAAIPVTQHKLEKCLYISVCVTYFLRCPVHFYCSLWALSSGGPTDLLDPHSENYEGVENRLFWFFGISLTKFAKNLMTPIRERAP